MERCISQSKFKYVIESLNTDDVLSVILKAMKLNFNLKFHAFSNTFYLLKGILKHVFLIRRWHFSYANQHQKEKQAGRFKWFYGFGKRKYLNNVWRNISLDGSDDAILILQNTKVMTSNVPGCVAGENKSQWNMKVIWKYISFRLGWKWESCFASCNIHVLFCLGNYYLNKTKPYF